jgi:hypothetical protein
VRHLVYEPPELRKNEDENISTKEQNPVVQKRSTTNLTGLLLQCVTEPDPMLSMLAWLCDRLMEAEVTAKDWCRKIPTNL